MPCFIAGVAVHLYREEIAWNLWLCALAVLTMTVIAAVPVLVALLPLPLIYTTVFLGTLDAKKIWPLTTGDYSYGIYLYGSPFVQAVFATVPMAHLWYVDFPIAAAITLLFAALSWHLVEKNCLALKPRLFALEAHLLESWPLKRLRTDAAAAPPRPK